MLLRIQKYENEHFCSLFKKKVRTRKGKGHASERMAFKSRLFLRTQWSSITAEVFCAVVFVTEKVFFFVQLTMAVTVTVTSHVLTTVL